MAWYHSSKLDDAVIFGSTVSLKIPMSLLSLGQG